MNLLPIQLADSTASGAVASFDFQSIPAGFAQLLLVVYARGDTAVPSTGVVVRFNNDSGSNYDWQQVLANATTTTAGEAFAQAQAAIGVMPASTASANLFGAIACVIPHYANTANNKSFTSDFAYKTGTSTTNLGSGQEAGFWRSNAAISRITVIPTVGNFVAGTRATLYGLA